ncbi:vacuolar segregation subunit 7-domain-containing protein [Lipomyces kononenkoae]|uniref:Vacuolar segregation subunit 7-domain-containing protein n=1 Tax=Lipomyces kononenkoae TaxID=34357 RepID=A0ACC3T1S6_LIPKO
MAAAGDMSVPPPDAVLNKPPFDAALVPAPSPGLPRPYASPRRAADPTTLPLGTGPLNLSSDDDRKREPISKSSHHPQRPLMNRTPSAVSQAHESESDSGYKSEDRPASVRKLFSTSAVSSLKNAPAKVGSTSTSATGSKAMTVETETVTTVPSVSVTTSAQGSVKNVKSHSKSSVKQKKKKSRPYPLTQGTSKADIFAAKIASAVGDHDSSDSDETFVYESNPRDSQPGKFKPSRSPSVTSLAASLSRQNKPGDSADNPMLPSGANSFRHNGHSKSGRPHDPRPLNNIYATNKGAGLIPPPPHSPRPPLGNRGAASAIAADSYIDDEGADGDVDYDYDESTPLAQSRRRRRGAKIERARNLRRSILVSCIVVVALIVGFSLGVIFVTSHQ